MVRIRGPLVDPNWEVRTIGLEDLILAYMSNTTKPEDAQAARHRSRAMTWLIWRQHRNQAALAAIVLGVLAIILAVTGVHMASTYHSALRACGATGTCDSVGDSLFNGDGAVIDLVNFTVVVPLILGLFWGAPLVAREIEDGTHTLIWTQSVTRRHWLAGKTVALLCATALFGGVLAVSVTWWSRTIDLSQHNRFNKFDVQGVVPVAYAIFGAALGLAAGVVIRRTLSALAATLAIIVGLRIVIANYLRPHYMTPLTKLTSIAASDTGLIGSSLTLHSHIVTGAGANVSNNDLLSVLPAACRQYLGTGRAQMFSCLGAQGWQEKILYQPANRFWTFQAIESGIFLALAAALVVIAFRFIRRDA